MEFADLLIRHGVVNAINLDGGGSNTVLEDGVLINYPSDHWFALYTPTHTYHFHLEMPISAMDCTVCSSTVPIICTGSILYLIKQYVF